LPLSNLTPCTIKRHVHWKLILKEYLIVLFYVPPEASLVQYNRLKVKHDERNLPKNIHHSFCFVVITILNRLGDLLVDGKDITKNILEPSKKDLSGTTTERVNFVNPENVVVLGSIKAYVVEIGYIFEE
jgi:hypothetical protein